METFRTYNGLFFYIQWFVFELIFFKKIVLKCFNPMKQKEIIEPGFEVLLKTNERKKMVKLTLKLISGAKSIFCTEMLLIGK